MDSENTHSEQPSNDNSSQAPALQAAGPEAVPPYVAAHNAAEDAWQKGDFLNARKAFKTLLSPDNETETRALAQERLKRIQPDGLAVAVSITIALVLIALWVLSIRAFP